MFEVLFPLWHQAYDWIYHRLVWDVVRSLLCIDLMLIMMFLWFTMWKFSYFFIHVLNLKIIKIKITWYFLSLPSLLIFNCISCHLMSCSLLDRLVLIHWLLRLLLQLQNTHLVISYFRCVSSCFSFWVYVHMYSNARAYFCMLFYFMSCFSS